jgi:hypothetical protein
VSVSVRVCVLTAGADDDSGGQLGDTHRHLSLSLAHFDSQETNLKWRIYLVEFTKKEKRDIYWQTDLHSYLTQYFSLQINHQTNQNTEKTETDMRKVPFLLYSRLQIPTSSLEQIEYFARE